MYVFDLDDGQEEFLFEKFPLFGKIGKEQFGIKLWILIKGIKEQTGEGVLVNALGHKPCIVMLEQGVDAVTIRQLLEELVSSKLIQIEKNMVEYARKYYVTLDTSTELNRILMQLNLIKILKKPNECLKILKAVGFYDKKDGSWDEIIKHGTKAFHILNEENGIATAKLIRSVCFHLLSEVAKQGASKIFPGFGN